MKAEYDFSNAKRNPYSKLLRKHVTVSLDIPTINYFKEQASATNIPYHTLINLYLSDCATNNRQPDINWR